MRIYVTGGSGYIGSALGPALRAAGHYVNPPGGRHTEPVKRPGNIEAAFARAIIHLACNTTGGDFATNIMGTAIVTDWARDHDGGRVIFASSLTAQLPRDQYDREKALGEQIVCARPDITAVVLRLGCVYGEPITPNRRSALNVLIERASQGHALAFYGNAGGARDFVHLSDVVSAFLAALKAPAGTYEVGTGRCTSLIEAGRLVAQRCGVPCQVAPDTAAVHHPVAREDRWLPGWTPRVDLETGLERTLGWLRTQQPTAAGAVA